MKKIIRLVIITALILLIPLIAMQFTGEVTWDLFDFIFMGALIFSTGLAYEIVSKKIKNKAHRIALGVALLIIFLLIWINGAVGIFGPG